MALQRMRSMVARTDRDELIWRRCSESTRRNWLLLARLPFSLAAFPWERLDETDRVRLKTMLTVSLDFLERAGRDSLAGRPR